MRALTPSQGGVFVELLIQAIEGFLMHFSSGLLSFLRVEARFRRFCSYERLHKYPPVRGTHKLMKIR